MDKSFWSDFVNVYKHLNTGRDKWVNFKFRVLVLLVVVAIVAYIYYRLSVGYAGMSIQGSSLSDIVFGWFAGGFVLGYFVMFFLLEGEMLLGTAKIAKKIKEERQETEKKSARKKKSV